MFLLIPMKVFASEVVNEISVETISKEEIGKITLYDDLKIVYGYKYTLKNIEITICPVDKCEGVEPQVYDSQLHVSDSAEFMLDQYIDLSNEGKYTIKAKGLFKMSNEGPYKSATLVYDFEPPKEDNEKDDKDGLFMNDPRFDESVDKAIRIFNEWVIPGIYVVLALTIIIKGVLVGIDVVKYSDKPEIRREKLKSLMYMAIAIAIGVLLNTVFGIITGLFNF